MKCYLAERQKCRKKNIVSQNKYHELSTMQQPIESLSFDGCACRYCCCSVAVVAVVFFSSFCAFWIITVICQLIVLHATHLMLDMVKKRFACHGIRINYDMVLIKRCHTGNRICHFSERLINFNHIFNVIAFAVRTPHRRRILGSNGEEEVDSTTHRKNAIIDRKLYFLFNLGQQSQRNRNTLDYFVAWAVVVVFLFRRKIASGLSAIISTQNVATTKKNFHINYYFVRSLPHSVYVSLSFSVCACFSLSTRWVSPFVKL